MNQRIARILDVNLNRAREAARVVEEYFRFIQNDAGAAARIKALRHALGEAAATLPPDVLLRARDTAGDVGCDISTPTENHRADPDAVATVNFKRLQEALRALEEYGKTAPAGPVAAPGGAFAARIKCLRYEAYILESETRLPRPLRSLHEARLMVIVTEAVCRLPLESVIEKAWTGGARCFQLREKTGTDRERYARLERGMRTLRRHGETLVIINDRVDMALALNADGVHLGVDDLPLAAVHAAARGRLLIGATVHTEAELNAVHAAPAGADGPAYLGAGAMFPTPTKETPCVGGPAWGARVTRAVNEYAADSGEGAAPPPVFAVGGISIGRLPELTRAGVERIAVSSAVCGADDPETAVRAFLAGLVRPNMAGQA